MESIKHKNFDVIQLNNRFIYILLFGIFSMLIFSIAAFRSKYLGTDTIEYYNDYLYNLNYYNEIGYNFYIDFLRFFSKNPNFMFFVSSLLITGMFSISFLMFTKLPLFSILIFLLLFYPHSLNTMRQFIAMSIFFLFCLYALKNKNLLLYFVFSILSVAFHYSMLICIPLFIVLYINFDKALKFLVALWAISVPFLFLDYTHEINIILNYSHYILVHIVPDLPNYLRDPDYLFYLRKELFFFNIVLCLIIYFTFKNIHNIDNFAKNLVLLYAAGIVFANFFSFYTYLARISLFFYIYHIYIITYFFYIQNKISYKYFYLAVCVAFFVSKFLIQKSGFQNLWSL